MSACPYSVFIMDKAFDDEDFMKLFTVLLKDPAVDYTKSIFLLTNYYMTHLIVSQTLPYITKNAHKEIVLRDFENVMSNIDSRGSMYGLPKFTIVLFVPLDTSHIRLCLQDELSKRKCTGGMEQNEVNIYMMYEFSLITAKHIHTTRSVDFGFNCVMVPVAVDIAIEKYRWNCIKN